MLSAAVTDTYISLGDAAITALLGYIVVFFGIALLMIVVVLLSKVVGNKKSEPVKDIIIAPPDPVLEAPTAPGVAGQLKLHDVEPRTAAMLMAIVANQMGKPINELRFISIKEVK